MKSEVLREIENSCDSIEDVRRKCSGIELDIYERAWLEGWMKGWIMGWIEGWAEAQKRLVKYRMEEAVKLLQHESKMPIELISEVTDVPESTLMSVNDMLIDLKNLSEQLDLDQQKLRL